MQDEVYGSLVPHGQVAILCDLAHRENISIEAILQELGLRKTKIFTEPGSIPASLYTTLLEHIDNESGDPSFWFRFGQKLDLPAYGLIGQVAASCENIKEALTIIAKYYCISSCGSALSAQEVEGGIYLHIYRSGFSHNQKNRIKAELLASILFSALRPFLGDGGDNVKFDFDFPSPPHHAIYNLYLNGNINFSTEGGGIYFPAQYMNLPTPHSNPIIKNLLSHECAQIANSVQSGNIALRVRAIVSAVPGEYPTQEYTAQQLAMSARSLGRQLKQANSSYQIILSDVKSERAANLLCNTKLPIEEIANRVGFSDGANFRRAFVKWTGVPPSEFRKLKLNAPNDHPA